MTITILTGCCLSLLATLPDKSVNSCVTSPPYWGLRNYNAEGQIGQEPTPEAYVSNIVKVFREVRRVLKENGTLWLNLGDSYATQGGTGKQGSTGQRADRRFTAEGTSLGGVPDGLKPKDLVGIPWRVALALQADGWYLRQDIIWHKPNPMPESVRDRCTKAHEYIFLLTKQEKYYFDYQAMQEPATGRAPGNKNHKYKAQYDADDGEQHRTKAGLLNVEARETRNRRSVWTVGSKPFTETHFATYPPDLIEPCILAGSPAGGTILDPFFGAGTTGLVAEQNGRDCIGIELNPEYVEIARKRLGMSLEQPQSIPLPRRDAEPQPDLFNFSAA